MRKSAAVWQKEFLQTHLLQESYLDVAEKWFEPFAAQLAARRHRAAPAIIVGVNGSQGSGKSTLCQYLVATLKHSYQLSAVTLSLDDFYLTKQERLQLSLDVHPLMKVRGVPGTHDMALLDRTLNALLMSNNKVSAPRGASIPRFDKAIDDRLPEEEWEVLVNPVDIILLEGWCLGVTPQTDYELLAPVNDLEKLADQDGSWRSYVNEKITTQFVPLYERVDQWLMLKAPSFDCVLRWRLEQEEKLVKITSPGHKSGLMNEKEIEKFIKYYQRLTEHCLNSLPASVDYLYFLDENRKITHCEYRSGAH